MTPHYEDDLVTLHHGNCLDVLSSLDDQSVDAVVCDPPYGLANTSTDKVAETVDRWIRGEREYMPSGAGFMGKPWDAFVPPVAVWDECLRVLKPGGHLLAFAGSRTADLMGLAIRLAGFDLRDSIAWLYGNGFPKSRSVDEALDKYLAGLPVERPEAKIRPGVYTVTKYLREARDRAGWTNSRIDALFGTNGMAGHWCTQASQPAVPSVRQWEILRGALGFGHELDDLVADLGANEREDAPDGPQGDSGPFLGTLRRNVEYDAVTGWGTALKPAFEPILVGRKPLQGTATANVQTFGTGGLNLDACRVAFTSAADERESKDKNRHADFGTAPGGNEVYGDFSMVERKNYDPPGRWPTNVVLDDSQAAELDRQTGVSVSRAGAPRGAASGDGWGMTATGAEYDDQGGASRFFPTFRYETKAPAHERPRDGDVSHPTVKPLDLMRWLVRLVTPPGGVVLEPFAGSGTTLEACVIEGFRCIGVEREATYLPLIVARLSKPIQPDLFGGAA